ncbi:hypothetical protein LTR37_021041 [Vermiconidia calcicola]|uniref:Uncharacterized protein n=1 Tax=Vermiconidia calcicola TaxID=1690605 RepID=A0ACC3M9I9_9PEZI|nr:hypothetical protein LTR37_021041 [Vermiconidia calcicola]
MQNERFVQGTDQELVQAILDAVCRKDISGVQRLHQEMKANDQPIPILQMGLAARQRGDVHLLRYLLEQGDWSESDLNYIRGYADGKISFDLFDILARPANPATATRLLSQNVQRGRDFVEVLLEKGAKVQPTHLQGAVRSSDVETLELLSSRLDKRRTIERIEYGTRLADPESHPGLFSEPDSKVRIIDEGGLLQIAAYYNRLEMVKYLLSVGADPNFVPFTDFSYDHRECVNGPPLYKALQGSRPNVEVVRVLVEVGADPSMKMERGQNCVEWNRRWNQGKGRDEIEKLFRERIGGDEPV